MASRTALVVGATGIAGRALLERLGGEEGWAVLAVARRCPAQPQLRATFGPNVIGLRLDLLDREAVHAALAAHRVTHLFFAASKFSTLGVSIWPASVWGQTALRWMAQNTTPLNQLSARLLGDRYWDLMNDLGGLGALDVNTTMFRHVLDAVSVSPHALEHAVLVTGGRGYGHHLGPFLYSGYESPYHEDNTPRAPGNNWYHRHEDALMERANARGFGWTVLRPSTMVGLSLSSGWNVGCALAVYASVLKHVGEPLHFPGTAVEWSAGASFSDAALLADMAMWALDAPAAQNQAFHCVNGAASSWSRVWPTVAADFGMAVARSRFGFSFERLLRDRPAIWEELVATHDLQPTPLRQLAGPSVLDRSCATFYDAVYSMDKARGAGFSGQRDDGESFLSLFARMRAQRLIPVAR